MDKINNNLANKKSCKLSNVGIVEKKTTAHDWQYYKRRNKEVTDDQTMSFFW